jgi:hypothetical protein
MFVISLIETNGAGAACSEHKPFTKHKRVQQLKTFRRVKRGIPFSPRCILSGTDEQKLELSPLLRPSSIVIKPVPGLTGQGAWSRVSWVNSG